ncbi:MAG: ACT domain-containing protein [Clostridia bacterium]|nr:ACT domain-containing protein [Clostridia bacterium]
MKAVITVLGKDRIGIIANVTTILAENNVNILDISQTILQDFFTMIMIVDMEKCKVGYEEIQSMLKKQSEKMGMSIRIQHEDIFNSMHNI